MEVSNATHVPPGAGSPSHGRVLPHGLQTCCSSPHPVFWGHAATALGTSCGHFDQALCSVVALIVSLQSHEHRISGQKIRDELGGSQAVSAPVFSSTNRPSSPSLLSYCSEQCSTPMWRSGKGHKKGKKRGLCALETEVLRITFWWTHDTSSTSTTGLTLKQGML